MKKRVTIAALAMMALTHTLSAVAQQSVTPVAKKGLGSLLSNASEDELMEADLAFQLKVAPKGSHTLLVELVPAKGYYLYKERIRFSLKDSNGITVGAVKLPTGEIKMDQIFGRTEVYRTPIQVEIALNRAPKANRVTLVASYQGCHEKLGVCYPPIDKTVTLALQ